MKKLSIVVPCYNVEKYISKCLDSLLKQTYNNFVVWAVDDGSPDRSKEIVKEYEMKDPRIHLICKKMVDILSLQKISLNTKSPSTKLLS